MVFLWNEVRGRIETGPLCDKKTSIIKLMWCSAGGSSVDYTCSGIGNTDQLSVKDSGKGDSDFNDSDSDISGDGGKKNFITFQPRSSEFSTDFLKF